VLNDGAGFESMSSGFTSKKSEAGAFCFELDLGKFELLFSSIGYRINLF